MLTDKHTNPQIEKGLVKNWNTFIDNMYSVFQFSIGWFGDEVDGWSLGWLRGKKNKNDNQK